jgi:hypothetical protein
MTSDPTGSVGPAAGRRSYLAAEPIHAMIYFTPHYLPAYEAAGLRGRRMGYFASRAAALGPVPADVVIATFFNFSPDLVRRAIPDAWSLAAPEAILAARLSAVDASLRQAWGDQVASPEVAEAAELAGVAALAATRWPQGRPLFAAHAALDWPREPHLALWHAQTLLREYRGDSHVALLTTAGLSPVEALVTHAATGAVGADVLRQSRAWSEADWAEGVAAVRARGWLATSNAGGSDTSGRDAGGRGADDRGADAGLTLSDTGRQFRQDLEDRTDELAVPAYAALGAEGCARLAELARPLSQAVIDSGIYRAMTLPAARA